MQARNVGALNNAKKLHVQRGLKQRKFIVSRRALQDFMKKFDMGASELNELIAFCGEPRRATIGAGTDFPHSLGMTNEPVIEFSEDHPALLGIYDERGT
jgi:hypothetical protein